MTKVPLRTYLSEIEDAIDEGQTDEAVAHCRHILKIFPKHTDSYRLLGKAFLEAQKYGNAADIFQRVLSAIPDDFISHLGMSIVREDEGNIDASLWHMERAFEIQPYNSAIQGEVRRLYGKRDGMEPAKARLTRGALARMYVKGGHYDQALSEIRATLANEPDRPDLQIILAEMFARSGENVKAIKACSTILKNLPFCLQANRLLAKLLQGTEREDESKSYLQRVFALDPYEAHLSSHTPTAQDVSERAVIIDRLSWDASMRATEPIESPEWASSLGVELEQPDSAGDDLPEWLSSESEDSPVTRKNDDFVPSASNDDEEIPEWMKGAGWGPSSGEAEEEPSAFPIDDDEDTGADPAIAADIPDWVKGMAPAAATSASEELIEDDSIDLDSLFESTSNEIDSGAPDWLADIESEDTPEITPSSPDQEDGLPDWISDVPADSADSVAAEPESGLPDWLGETKEEARLELPDAQAADDIPEWLKGVEDDKAPTVIESESQGGVTDFLADTRPPESSQDDQTIEAQPLAGDEISDWLAGIESDDSPEITPSSPDQEDGLPDWISDVPSETSESGATEPESVLPDWLEDTKEEAELDEAQAADDIPEWLKGVEDDKAPTVIESESEGGVTDFLSGVGTARLSTDGQIIEAQPISGDEIPDWLKSSDSQPPAPGEPIGEPEPQSLASASDDPDWLQDIGGDSTPESEVDDTDIPDWLKSPKEETPEISPAESTPEASTAGDDIPDWLTSVDDADAAPAEIAEEPESTGEADGIPDWLKSAGDTDVEPVAAEDEVLLEPAEEAAFESIPEAATEADQAIDAVPDDAPDWLRSLDKAEQKMESEETAPDSTAEEPDVPDWLDELADGTLPEEVSEGLDLPVEPKADSTPDWLAEISEEPATEPDQEIPTPQAGRIAPAQPIEQLEDESFKFPTLDDFKSEPETEPEADLPEWLSTSDAPETEIEATEDGEPAAVSTDEEAAFPEWLASPSKETPAEEPEIELEDPDAAMAWLEGLAEKQGISEDELLTSPEERPEELPTLTTKTVSESADDIEIDEPPTLPAPSDELEDADASLAWLDGQATKQGVSEEELLTRPEEPSEELPTLTDEPAKEIDVEEPATLPAPIDELEDSDDAMAWLEGLAAKQGVSEEELLSSPEERPDAPPEWVQDTPAEPEEVPIEEPPEAAAIGDMVPNDIPEWLQDSAFSTADADPAADISPAAGAAEESDAIPDWLQDVDAEPETDEDPTWIREFGKDVPSFEQVTEETVAEQEQPVDAKEEYTWQPSEAEPQVDADSTVIEKLDFNEASLRELERLPGIGFRRAQAIFSHRKEHGPFNKLDDLLPLGIEEETVEGIKPLVEVIVPKIENGESASLVPKRKTGPISLPTTISPEDAQDKHHSTQIAAQGKLSQGDITGAMTDYDQLIKKGKRVDEIIADLEAANQAEPDDTEILQVLGDAYMRADRLQEALDTYSKAEQLLQ